MKQKLVKSTTLEIFTVIGLIYSLSLMLKQLNVLTPLNLLSLTLILFFACSKWVTKYLTFDLRIILATVFLMNWSLAITGMEYLVYEFDWNSFGIPINQNNNPELYSNDLLANQSYPHFWIYKLTSYFVSIKHLEPLFFIGFALQNYFVVKCFQIIYENISQKENIKYAELVVIFPLFLYPQISGHYTSLPFFLPAILGYSLAIYNISNFIYRDKRNIEDYLYLILLIFIHPFWSLFVPLYLAVCYFLSKNNSYLNSFLLLSVFSVSLLLNNLDGISILEIYKSELIYFYKSTVKIHFDWSAHIGVFFRNNLNNYYQQFTLSIIVIVLLIKKSILNFKTIESTFYTSLGWISFIIILGNLFHDSNFNNFLIASNFYRIGSLVWFFIGIFVFENIRNRAILIVFTSLPFIFYIYSSQQIYSKSIRALPNFSFSSKYTYFFIFLAITLYFFNDNKNSFRISIFGFCYYFIFYFIDRVSVENYLLLAASFTLLLNITIFIITKKTLTSSQIVTLTILILFSLSTLTTSSLTKNIKYEYQTQLSITDINLIQGATNYEDVILVDPTLSYFRKETKRGMLIDYAVIPYNVENYELYKEYKNYFISNNLSSMSSDQIELIIKNTNINHLILPLGSKAESYFIERYSFINLNDLGQLFLNVDS